MGSRYALVAFATSRSFVIAAAVVGVHVAHPDHAGNSAHGAGLVDVGWPVDVWATGSPWSSRNPDAARRAVL